MEDPEWLVPAGSQLAYLALASDDFNEVVKITEQILERDPENVRVLLMRANAYAHSKKDPELALADAKRVFEIDRDATEAYEPLILALLGLGKLKEAKRGAGGGGRPDCRARPDGGGRRLALRHHGGLPAGERRARRSRARPGSRVWTRTRPTRTW